MSFTCLYVPKGCQECDGDVPRDRMDQRFCCDDCAADQAERVAEIEARAQARRDNEDAFADAVEDLRAKGYTYEEIDEQLAGWPT